MQMKLNKISHALGFKGSRGYILGGCAIALNTLFIAPAAIAQEEINDVEESSGVEEIVVTARFREENLQETPIAITAITGEELEARGITNIVDLGLAIPNSNIRESNNAFGPTPNVGMRGVNTAEFIYTSEPGVGIYVDDVYHGTLTGSNLDLMDLERVEVLRGPQGTLFGKNSLGGAIRMISKAPQGDDTGDIQVIVGTSNRLDLKGSFDFSLIPDTLFLRIAGVSKQRDGYMDVIDFTCQMIANGTPELAGSLPSQLPGSEQNNGDCKINENGGSASNAGRAMVRWLPADDFELNWAMDYNKTVAQNGVDTLLKGGDPTDFFHGTYVTNVIEPMFGITYLDDRFVTGDPFTTYADHNDPVYGAVWPTDVITESWSSSVKADWDIGENLHLKGILAYRTYDSDWASDGDYTPFDTSTTLNNQFHEQTTAEIQLSGLALEDKLEWTAGLYYYDSTSHLGGFVTLPQVTSRNLGFFIIDDNFAQDDGFTNESTSAFIHGVYEFTEKLGLSAGIRYTDESKSYTFSHYFDVPDPLNYGEDNVDYKLSLDYQFNEDTLGYIMTSTGFRSSGANPRPFTIGQLQPFPGESLVAYEIGLKTDFFDNSLRVNTALFLNDYDPRSTGAFGYQCTFPDNPDPGERFPDSTCPEGTELAGLPGSFWFDSISTSGTATGAELEVSWNPTDNFAMNGTVGYFKYEADAELGEDGYLDPGYLEQPDFSFSAGAQYTFFLNNGGSIVSRLDWFYVGERTNSAPTEKPIAPYHYVPDYSLLNGRITFTSGDRAWNVSLEASNLLDEFYWINLGAERESNGIDPNYTRTGTPGRGRELALTFQRNFN